MFYEDRKNFPYFNPRQKLVFTFNPGTLIDQIELDGDPTDYSFANGLLEIDSIGSVY